MATSQFENSSLPPKTSYEPRLQPVNSPIPITASSGLWLNKFTSHEESGRLLSISRRFLRSVHVVGVRVSRSFLSVTEQVIVWM